MKWPKSMRRKSKIAFCDSDGNILDPRPWDTETLKVVDFLIFSHCKQM